MLIFEREMLEHHSYTKSGHLFGFGIKNYTVFWSEKHGKLSYYPYSGNGISKILNKMLLMSDNMSG